MTGIEWLILALVAYCTAAPDGFTLAATRGAAGAVRAGVSGSSTRSSTRSGGRKRGSSSGPVHTVTSAPSSSRWAAARAGWREGAQTARERRYEGRDWVGRTRRVGAVLAHRYVGRPGRLGRVASWLDTRLSVTQPVVVDVDPIAGDVVDDDQERTDVDGSTTPMPDHISARVQEALSELRDLVPNGQLRWVAGWTPTDPRRNAEGSTVTPTDEHTTGEQLGEQLTDPSPIQGEAPTMQTTDLESLDAVDAEVSAAVAMCESITETITQAQQWAAGLADRWAGTDWGTADLDASVASVAEAAAALGSPESLAESLAAVKAAVEKARAVGEVVAEHGATGRADAFTAA